MLLTEVTHHDKYVLDDDQRQFLQQNCSEALEMYQSSDGNNVIYRGQGNFPDRNNPAQIKTLTPEEWHGAANIRYNYHYYLLDKHPEWQDIPSRTRSIDCTTSAQKASNYAATIPSIVLWQNGATWASGPAADFWYMFNETIPRSAYMTGVNDFVHTLHLTLWNIARYSDVNMERESSLTEQQFWDLLDQLDQSVQTDTLKQLHNRLPENQQIIISAILKHKSFKDALFSFFNPTQNNIIHGSANDVFSMPNANEGLGRECWTESTIYLIHPMVLKYTFNTNPKGRV